MITEERLKLFESLFTVYDGPIKEIFFEMASAYRDLKTILALAAIPLEVLRATEMDSVFLCDEIKKSILEATDAIRRGL